eukprot:TRINITY_DN4720_c0_g1_i2.p1 TRINITY_DN4720_c0_g1~~TRINITY_DN4720_c0_g1_i2.p1  ORF type:complete len:132 (-),score=9.85 TRINITY_DN4720_c0_g1_i2:258-653(-)
MIQKHIGMVETLSITLLNLNMLVSLSEDYNKTVRKNANFRKKFLKQWTNKIYMVLKVTRPTKGRPMYIINSNDLSKKEFYRDELQLINKQKLIKRKPILKIKKRKKKVKKKKIIPRRTVPKRDIRKPSRFK